MVRLNRESNIEFYVGTDVKGNKIPIPFENILICGYSGTGKSMFMHNLIQDALLRYPSSKIKFKVWSRTSEYELWDVSKSTDGMRSISNVEIVREDYSLTEGSQKSITDFLVKIIGICHSRYGELKESGAKNIWEYNRRCVTPDSEMIPFVYVVDDWSDELSDEGAKALSEIIALGRSCGVSLIWICQSTKRMNSKYFPMGEFHKNFVNRVVFHTTDEVSVKVIGSNYCANEGNRGVGRGMCIYQRRNGNYVPLDIPKFSYSLGRKIARALSQEV